ncbi:MAG: hypothetical protein PHR62_05825 [Paludibacter sp.]|nr:hypothetical protein [Paludibacter sp.]
MKKTYIDNNTERKKYETPEITVVKLDTEISLQMASDPNPLEEPDNWSHNQNSIAPDPWKGNLG